MRICAGSIDVLITTTECKWALQTFQVDSPYCFALDHFAVAIPSSLFVASKTDVSHAFFSLILNRELGVQSWKVHGKRRTRGDTLKRRNLGIEGSWTIPVNTWRRRRMEQADTQHDSLRSGWATGRTHEKSPAQGVTIKLPALAQKAQWNLEMTNANSDNHRASTSFAAREEEIP